MKELLEDILEWGFSIVHHGTPRDDRRRLRANARYALYCLEYGKLKDEQVLEVHKQFEHQWHQDAEATFKLTIDRERRKDPVLHRVKDEETVNEAKEVVKEKSRGRPRKYATKEEAQEAKRKYDREYQRAYYAKRRNDPEFRRKNAERCLEAWRKKHGK